MTTLAIVTRVHPARPSMLKINCDSVSAQSSDDLIHILHRHDSSASGYGVPSANASLSLIKKIDARFTMILDDDDMLIDRDFARDFAALVKDRDPDMIYFRGMIKGKGIFPKPNVWKRIPVCGSIGSFNYAVRTGLWLREIHHFEERVKGDFAFVAACHARSREHIWWDRLVVSTQRLPGFGKGERDHA